MNALDLTKRRLPGLCRQQRLRATKRGQAMNNQQEPVTIEPSPWPHGNCFFTDKTAPVDAPKEGRRPGKSGCPIL